MPINDVSGKIFASSHVSHRTLYGTKHTYTWDPTRPMPKTFGRLIHREALSQASFFASKALRDAQSAAFWGELRRKEPISMPMNAFIIKHKLPEIKAALIAAWKERPLEEFAAYIEQQKLFRLRSKQPSLHSA